MIPVLCFDIETVPDVAGLRVLYDLPATLADSEVAEFAFQRQRIKNGTDFLPLHMHRVVSIACALADSEGFRVWSLAAPELSEATLIQRFFQGVEKYTPQLVSWNGGGFDLPVLHYRGLMHGVCAPRYWESGDGDYTDAREFRWNNYINRYHQRHLDLMDVLARYQARASVPLDQLAKLMGFPGKLGMDGSAVWPAWQRGEAAAIRDYCETDAVNTYLVYLRFEQMRGHLDALAYQHACGRVRAALAALAGPDKPHWQVFLNAWPDRAENPIR